ncbi:hypothetical protein HS7_04350 [Sulfolobales archaeon HS-7]|nr:hypothetical protein HS7_04350 [Sulfolobales archaeon HS-7]
MGSFQNFTRVNSYLDGLAEIESPQLLLFSTVKVLKLRKVLIINLKVIETSENWANHMFHFFATTIIVKPIQIDTKDAPMIA